MPKPYKVKPRKDGKYFVSFTTTEGRRVRKSTSTCEKTVADKRAKQIYLEEIQRDLNPAKVGKTFAEAVEAYIEAEGEKRFMEKPLLHFGDMLIDQIDEVALTEACIAIYPDAAPDTRRRQVITPVRSAINFALGLRRKKSSDKQRTRWLTPEEADELLKAADERTRPKIAFLLGSGCRPGEMFALERKFFYAKTNEAWIEDTKNSHPRMVRFPDRAMSMLGPLPDVGAIFRTPKGLPYKLRKNGGGQMMVAFNKARDDAGLGSDVVPYTCRHTWATWYYSQTRDFGGLMDLGGWQKADMANRYRKIAPADLPQRLLEHGWDFGVRPGVLEHGARMLQDRNTQ